MSVLDVSPKQAQRIALWSQGLLGGRPSPAQALRARRSDQIDHVRAVLDRLGAVQLDTISVLARSHELVAYARLGAIPRSAIEDAYWSGDHAFEYWSHAACILPIDRWPLFAFRRRHFRARGERWHGVPRANLERLKRRIRDDGPVTAAHVGGAKKGGEWWDWSDEKIALEWLLDIGELVVTRRVGWRRTYDLAERVIPATLFHDDLDDDACLIELVKAGAQTVGIGTAADIADVHRLPRAVVARHARAAGLVPVVVPGWPRTWASPEALAWLETGAGSGDRHRTTLLSPFDSLVWFRERVERIFGMRHRIEAYTPASKRVHGYFAMPVLHRGELIARVDPGRSGAVLEARTVTFESAPGWASGSVPESAVHGTAAAIREAAAWVGCADVRIGSVVPARMATPLRAAIHN